MTTPLIYLFEYLIENATRVLPCVSSTREQQFCRVAALSDKFLITSHQEQKSSTMVRSRGLLTMMGGVHKGEPFNMRKEETFVV